MKHSMTSLLKKYMFLHWQTDSLKLSHLQTTNAGESGEKGMHLNC